MTLDEKFQSCIRVKRKDGELEIGCRLGLWSCCGRDSSPSREQLWKESRHYWIQYYEDGEYSALLASVPRSQTSGGMEGEGK